MSPWDIIIVGTYSLYGSKGIYSFKMDRNSGRLTLADTNPRCCNPSFLAFHPTKPIFYAANEVPDRAYITAYTYDPATGKIQWRAEQTVPGRGMCHILCDSSGRTLYCANYESGNVAVCALTPSGDFGPLVESHQHQGASVVPERQCGPHTHGVYLDHAGRFLIAVDLGIDKLMIYKVDKETGGLTPNPAQPYAQMSLGEGPRHAAFHPSGKYLYVVSELANHIVTYRYDEALGTLEEIQSVDTLPDGFAGFSLAGEVAVTNDGKTLYACNRFYDSLVRFSIDPETGLIARKAFHSCLGGNTRHFAFSPDNRYLFLANQTTRNLVVCRFDQNIGEIGARCDDVYLPAAACVLHAPAIG